MVKPLQLIPTLSPKGASGSTLYNSYYFFTQLSALYAGVLESVGSEEEKNRWTRLSDGSLNDIEKLYGVWEWALSQIKAGKMKPEIDSEWTKVALACRRMAVVHRHTNLWTSRVKWARICSLCEYRWQKMIAGFKIQSDELFQLVAPLHLSSVARQNLLEEHLSECRNRSSAIDSWFRPVGGSSPSEASLSSPNNNQPETKLKKVGVP